MFATEKRMGKMKVIKSSVIVGILFLALITISCSSQCECTLYENGVVIGSSTEKAEGQSCEAFSNGVETPYGKMGMECVKKTSFMSE